VNGKIDVFVSIRMEGINMILPDDVLGVIREYSRPYMTRPNWRTCKEMEAWNIHQYYDMYNFLFYSLDWYAVTDESGYRIFYDEEDIHQFLKETKMVPRLIQFESRVPVEMHLLDLLYVWFEHNWALGIAALPAE